MPDDPRPSSAASRVLNGLAPGDAIARECSSSEEANRSGGFVYFKRSNGRPVDPEGARELIEKGVLLPADDGLFGVSQCFERAGPSDG